MHGKIVPAVPGNESNGERDIEKNQPKRRCYIVESIKAIAYGNVLPFLPVTIFLSPVFFLGTSYIVGISRENGISKTPHLHDLKTNQPENGLFMLSMSITATACTPCIILRYFQIYDISSPDENRSENLFAIFCGLFHVFGGCVFYSFKEEDSSFAHYFGVLLYFLFGVLYMSVQSEFSRRLIKIHTRFLSYFRTLLSICGVLTILIYFPVRIFAPKEKSRYFVPQVCEWFLTGIFSTFFLSFVYDFNMMWCSIQELEEETELLVESETETQQSGQLNETEKKQIAECSRKILTSRETCTTLLVYNTDDSFES